MTRLALAVVLAPVLYGQAPLDCQERVAEDFVPMTKSERLVNAERSTVGLNAVLATAVDAAIFQAMDRNTEWGQGTVGFARRFGNSYAQLFIEQTIEQSSAMLLHEDNRYFASGKHGVGRRLMYALKSTVLARKFDGSQTISISGIGGAAGAAFFSRPWQPRSNSGYGDAAIMFGTTMAVRAGMNVMREFSPRVLGFLFR